MSIKKIIRLEAIDPIEIYGAANRNLESLCSYFPELKVVARGEEIILEGTDTDVSNFEQKLLQLIERRQHKRNITPYDVEDLFDGESSPDRYKLCGNSVIVHGNDGKPIKARNRTQEEMVKAYFENDLIFAVGPAGTGKTYIAIALAVRALKNREIKRIILTRPAVEALHASASASGSPPKRPASPHTSSGLNTRKPQDAASDTPTTSPKMTSISIKKFSYCPTSRRMAPSPDRYYLLIALIQTQTQSSFPPHEGEMNNEGRCISRHTAPDEKKSDTRYQASGVAGPSPY